MTAFDTPKIPPYAVQDLGGATWFLPPGWSAITRATQAALQGSVTASMRHSALRQDLVRETLADFLELSRAREPEELLHTEILVARRFAERSVRVMRALQQEMLCSGIM